MAVPSERTEGIRVLDDFVCEAKPGPGLVVAITPGHAADAGVRIVAEIDLPTRARPEKRPGEDDRR